MDDVTYQQLVKVISLTRSRLMDILEGSLSGHQNWKWIRTRTLSCLGDRGLMGAIDEIAGKANFGKGNDDEFRSNSRTNSNF